MIRGFQRLRQYVERMRHGRLSHPNISRALELCTDGSILGTLMPLYTPGNVIQYLQRYPGSTDRERIDFVRPPRCLHSSRANIDCRSLGSGFPQRSRLPT